MNNIISLVQINFDTKNYEVVAQYRYNAWGEHIVYDANGSINTSDTFIGNINPFRYKGYYYDVETQLFYCNSRYYSPELCRFISPDSIEHLDPESINGLNLYCYCANNSVMCRLGYNLGGVISASISNIGSISSNISSRSRSSSAKSMSRTSALGNISHTTTIQHNNSGVFYAY